MPSKPPAPKFILQRADFSSLKARFAFRIAENTNDGRFDNELPIPNLTEGKHRSCFSGFTHLLYSGRDCCELETYACLSGPSLGVIHTARASCGHWHYLASAHR